MRPKIEIDDEMVRRALRVEAVGNVVLASTMRRVLEAALNGERRKGDRRAGELLSLKEWLAKDPIGGLARFAEQTERLERGAPGGARKEEGKEAPTVAVGPVPNRTDGLLSLHVGGSFVYLSQTEARHLKSEIDQAMCHARVRDPSTGAAAESYPRCGICGVAGAENLRSFGCTRPGGVHVASMIDPKTGNHRD